MSLLVGGVPGSGKSNLVQQMAAWAALDPTARLYCLDPKLVELARWEPVAAGFAGPDLGEAITLLREVEGEMHRRITYLHDHNIRKFTAYDDVGMVMVVIDELAVYLAGDRKQAAEFSNLLRNLVLLVGRLGSSPCWPRKSPRRTSSTRGSVTRGLSGGVPHHHPRGV